MGSMACCLPAGIDSKALLSENWITKAAEAAEAAAAAATPAAPPPAFNPADPQYNELARRLSTSAAMRKVQELQAGAAQQEKQLQGLAGEAKEAKKAELEETQQQLSEAQAALTELQASFEQDPLSLTPWMNGLFALADGGCTTFDCGGAVCTAHPPPGTSLLELLAPPVAASGGPAGVSAWLYREAEKVLGTFKRRYELERGLGQLRIVARLALSPFGGAATAELAAAAEAGMEASRQAVLGPEGAAAGGVLDTVLLHWLDYEDIDAFVTVLLALKRSLAPPGYDPAAAAEAGGLETPPKLAALGLVDPPAAAITAAMRAGVPLSAVSLPFNLLDTAAAPLLQLCIQHGIKVLASSPTAHGLISETFLGTAAPDTAGGSVAGCDNLAAGLDMVARYGGWVRFQELLKALKGLADKHNTSLQVVALSWLQQQGVVPLLPAHWGTASNGSINGSSSSSGGGSGSGAPWPLTLGLQHYSLTPPPAVSGKPSAAAAAAAAAAAVVSPPEVPEAAPASAAAAGQEEGEKPAAAVEGAEGAAEGGAAGEAVDAKAPEAVAPAVAVAAAAPAAAPAVAPTEGAVEKKQGVSKGGRWVEGLGQLLSGEDLAVLAAVVGWPGWPAAA